MSTDTNIHDGATELAGLLAHELNQPLAQIAGAVELLRFDDVTADEREQAVAIIGRSVVHAQQVVARLASLRGSASLIGPRRPTDLVALAREVVADLRDGVLGEHPVTIEGGTTVSAMVDPVAVRQVLINLLTNAATYSPAGRAITVAVAGDDTTASITVRDQGRGVAPEDAERIFDAWERGARSGPGLGLGLYLSRRIARAHDGDVRLEPADQQGSIFVVELPIGDVGAN